MALLWADIHQIITASLLDFAFEFRLGELGRDLLELPVWALFFEVLTDLMSRLMVDITTAQQVKPSIVQSSIAASGAIALVYVVGRVLNLCTEFDPHGPPSG